MCCHGVHISEFLPKQQSSILIFNIQVVFFFCEWELSSQVLISDIQSSSADVAANEFRLLMEGGGHGTDSPAPGGCGPELPLARNPKKSTRRRTVSLRAPTTELKAVWQNLIQRQM